MRNLNTCTLERSRRAITGIIVALIIFATLFSAGVGYYLYAGQASLLSAQGAIARQGGVQGAMAESLIVTPGPVSGSTCSGCVLEVSVSNSGGVPVTMTAVFVTSSLGQALSKSASGSEFLTSGNKLTGDLNVTLPVSLAVGEGTGSLKGCGPSLGCAIGIRSTLTSSTMYVSILTSRGNTFTAEYCPSTCPNGVGQTTTNTIASTTTSTSSSTSYTTTTTTLYTETSSTVISGFQPGTNSLIITMQACAGTTSPGQSYGSTCPQPQPSAVYSTEEVILIVTVTNLASVAMGVVVDFQPVPTSGAGVTPQSQTQAQASGADYCPSQGSQMSTPTKNINPGQSQPFTCTFSAVQGASGGTVTFLGYAVGTYPPSGYVTSAETLSNPIEIGNPLSSIAGPFVGLGFNYASQGSQTFGSAAILSYSSKYVIFQATLENTANASVTVLDYSFLLSARVSQEHLFYIVSGSSWSSSLSSYTCVLGTANAPTGAQCSTAQTNCTVLGNGCVPTGGTVSLDFAASDMASSAWQWGSSCCASGGMNPPEVITAYVVIEYDYYNAGVWHVLSQSIPITGTYLTN